LRRLDEEFPEKLKLHLVLDNYGTHKHPKVQSWLERHPRFTVSGMGGAVYLRGLGPG
jgi:hypothetical protein